MNLIIIILHISMIQKIICFDVGGSKIAKAVVKVNWKKRAFTFLDYEIDTNPRKPTEIKKILLDFATTARKAFGTNLIAVSTARVVDPIRKTVREVKNHYGINVFRFDFFEKEGFQLKVANDGHSFAMGEYYFGEHGTPTSLMSIALGTGMGCGLVINGVPYRGAHGTAMELSHMKVEKDGYRCDCKQKGCWERYAGGVGMQELYYRTTGKRKTAEEIFETSSKDKDARDVKLFAMHYLQLGLVNVLNIYDPEVMVFGGNISHQTAFIKEVITGVKKNVLNQKARYIFRISKLKDKANLLGAAALWKDETDKSSAQK